jgi:hypothetical protein
VQDDLEADGAETVPAETPPADWETSVQKIYDRKTQERRPVREGDPQRYRQVAAELSARQQVNHQSLAGEGLIDDQTPLTGGEYRPIVLPSPRGDYPYWRQITGTSFIEHEVVADDLRTQQVDFVFAKVAWEIFQQFGLEAAYVFLLMATRLLKASNPWDEIIELRTRDLLGLNIWERGHGLSRGKRLRMAGNWFELVCNLSLLVSQVDSATARFRALRVPFWVLEEMEYSGTVTSAIGGYQPEEARLLTVRVGLGLWPEQFMAVSDQAKQVSLAQFAHQAATILQIDPTRKPLAAKLGILWLLVSRLTPAEAAVKYAVGGILEQVESKASLIEMQRRKDRRNTILSRWHTNLHRLQKLGWTIEFDPQTYPAELQPNWQRGDGPSIARESDMWLDCWLQAQVKITPPVLVIPEPVEVDLPLSDRFTGNNLAQALELKGLTRAKLAEYLKLDRSMVTYWIKGARLIQPKHRAQIYELLGEELEQVACQSTP